MPMTQKYIFSLKNFNELQICHFYQFNSNVTTFCRRCSGSFWQEQRFEGIIHDNISRHTTLECKETFLLRPSSPCLWADVILMFAGGVQQPRSWPMALQNRMSQTPQAWDFLSRSATAQGSACSRPRGARYRSGTRSSSRLQPLFLPFPARLLFQKNELFFFWNNLLFLSVEEIRLWLWIIKHKLECNLNTGECRVHKEDISFPMSEQAQFPKAADDTHLHMQSPSFT